MTASLTVLAGCPAPTTTTSPSPDASVAPSASAAPVASTAPVASASAAPAAQSSTTPDKVTGGTSDIKELATFNGKVYDTSGVPVDGAKVTAKSIDAGVPWTGQDQMTANGAYVFRNAPVGARIEITATKDGWTRRLRTEVLKSNLTGNPDANKYDFGGPTDTANIYSIQDEPEITSLKINGKQALDSDTGSTLNPSPRVPETVPGASLTGITSDSLTVEMSFSEPVRQDDVQNYFRITSQNIFSNTAATRFTVDQNLAGTNFAWSADGTSVTFTTNKAILANSSGDEARYMADFSQAFRDKTDKPARTQRYFKFSASKANDYHVFSVANQSVDPILVSVAARDGGSGNDFLDLTFNKAMDVINQTVPAALLADPKAPTNVKRQLILFNTSNDGYNKAIGQGTNALKNTTGNITLANETSLLGYTTVDNSLVQGNFIPVYSIGRLTSQDLNGPSVLAPAATANLPAGTTAFTANAGTPDVLSDVVSLYSTSMNSTANPPVSFSAYKTLKLSSLGCGTAGVGDQGPTNSVKSVKVNGKVITIELDPKAFDKNDRVVVAVGGNITGKYDDKNNSISRNELKPELTINGAAFANFATITDPSSRTIASANSSTSANLKITDNQKVSTAN